MPVSKIETTRESESLNSVLLDAITHDFITPLTSTKASVTGSLGDLEFDREQRFYHGVVLVLETKNLEVAEKDLRTYIDSVPDNSELPAHSSAYEWLGKLYKNENKPKLAAEQYKAAPTLDPQNKALREALKRLPKK